VVGDVEGDGDGDGEGDGDGVVGLGDGDGDGLVGGVVGPLLVREVVGDGLVAVCVGFALVLPGFGGDFAGLRRAAGATGAVAVAAATHDTV
jgi:hypothetical protein